MIGINHHILSEWYFFTNQLAFFSDHLSPCKHSCWPHNHQMWSRFEAKCWNRGWWFNFTSYSNRCCQVQSCKMLPARCSVLLQHAHSTSLWHVCKVVALFLLFHCITHTCLCLSGAKFLFFIFFLSRKWPGKKDSSCTETSDGRDKLIQSPRHRFVPCACFHFPLCALPVCIKAKAASVS